MADERKQAGKRLNDYNKEKVSTAVKNAQEDSDEDDLAGWHLDWSMLIIIIIFLPLLVLE